MSADPAGKLSGLLRLMQGQLSAGEDLSLQSDEPGGINTCTVQYYLGAENSQAPPGKG